MLKAQPENPGVGAASRRDWAGAWVRGGPGTWSAGRMGMTMAVT